MNSQSTHTLNLLHFEDVLVHISQFCDWNELLKFARLCHLSLNVIQTNQDCWANSHLSFQELTKLATHLKHQKQREQREQKDAVLEDSDIERNFGKSFSVRNVLQHNRLLRNVAKITMRISETDRKQSRDQLQMFKHLRTVRWKFSRDTPHRFEDELLNNLACELVNESAPTMIEIHLSGKKISHLKWLHSNIKLVFPRLTALGLHVVKDKVLSCTTLISKHLPQLTSLRLCTGKKDKLAPETISSALSPIIEHMQHSLTTFETNLHLSPELILKFLVFTQLKLEVHWKPEKLIHEEKSDQVSISSRRSSSSSDSSSTSTHSISSDSSDSDDNDSNDSDDDDTETVVEDHDGVHEPDHVQAPVPEQTADPRNVEHDAEPQNALDNAEPNSQVDNNRHDNLVYDTLHLAQLRGKIVPEFSNQDIQFLAACKEFHQPPRHRLSLLVYSKHFTKTQKQFELFLYYTRQFRETLDIEQAKWIVAPNLNPWRTMSTCIALNRIEIAFPFRPQPALCAKQRSKQARLTPAEMARANQDQVSLEQIQCLRPIYKQLHIFRLTQCWVKLSTLLQLTKETEQMTNLIHKDVFIECNILPETDSRK